MGVPRSSSRRSLLFFVPYFQALSTEKYRRYLNIYFIIIIIFILYFPARLDFPSPPISAPGSPRMASYVEYSRVQTLKAYKWYKIVLSYAHVIVFYSTLEINNLLWNFSLKWFLCEECLKWKFQPDRFWNFRFLYVGFYCIKILTWLRGFRVKITIFCDSVVSQFPGET